MNMNIYIHKYTYFLGLLLGLLLPSSSFSSSKDSLSTYMYIHKYEQIHIFKWIPAAGSLHIFGFGLNIVLEPIDACSIYINTHIYIYTCKCKWPEYTHVYINIYTYIFTSSWQSRHIWIWIKHRIRTHRRMFHSRIWRIRV